MHSILRRYQWHQWHLQLLSQAHFLSKTSLETRMLLLRLMQWLTRTWGWMPKGGPSWRKTRRVAIETGWTGSTQQHSYMFLSTWSISTPVSADSSWSWVALFWCICKCVVLIFALQRGFTEVLSSVLRSASWWLSFIGLLDLERANHSFISWNKSVFREKMIKPMSGLNEECGWCYWGSAVSGVAVLPFQETTWNHSSPCCKAPATQQRRADRPVGSV